HCKMRTQMDRSVHAHLDSLLEPCTMKDRRTGSDEDLVFNSCADDVSVRTNQAVVADRAVMPMRSANHRILHDYDVAADADLTAPFGYDPGTVKDARSRSDRDVAADRRIGCDPCVQVEGRSSACVLDQHVCFAPFAPRT